jgi:hypothetical protein
MMYGIYQENEDDRLELMLIYTDAFRTLEDADVMIVQMAQKLADTDYHSVKIVSGEEVTDFERFLGEGL